MYRGRSPSIRRCTRTLPIVCSSAERVVSALEPSFHGYGWRGAHKASRSPLSGVLPVLQRSRLDLLPLRYDIYARVCMLLGFSSFVQALAFYGQRTQTTAKACYESNSGVSRFDFDLQHFLYRFVILFHCFVGPMSMLRCRLSQRTHCGGVAWVLCSSRYGLCVRGGWVYWLLGFWIVGIGEWCWHDVVIPL